MKPRAGSHFHHQLSDTKEDCHFCPRPIPPLNEFVAFAPEGLDGAAIQNLCKPCHRSYLQQQPRR